MSARGKDKQKRKMIFAQHYCAQYLHNYSDAYPQKSKPSDIC
jgi:hypothetical protein